MTEAVRKRRTTMVPITTMEEVPVLTPAERAELLASLEKATADIEAGAGAEYDPGKMKNRLLQIHRRER